ncbi:MAG: transposase, partial [Desulfobacteraceae bacterium]|nr:transposase [Desulfobacteraceae bacterium]
TFPTDLKILNEAREKSERIIDILHQPHRGKLKKPRTYRKQARKQFVSVAKSKKASKSKMRKAMRKQLGYPGRNLKTINKLSKITPLSQLDKRMYKLLLVINEVYRQQKWMYEQRVNRIDDRIVNIYQPYVRPIKRGKAGAGTEFGAKISVSAIDGYCYLDRLSWDAYNEPGDLIDQAEAYRARFGYYPASVHADTIYRNRKNIKFCKKHGIRLSGPALGRPPSQIEKQKAAQKQVRQDELDRIPIEGRFGQGKRRFSLAKIMSKLDNTSETVIAVVFLVMNLEKWLKSLFFFICFYFFMGPILGIQGVCRTVRSQLERKFGYSRNQIGLLSLLYLQKQIVQEALRKAADGPKDKQYCSPYQSHIAWLSIFTTFSNFKSMHAISG